MWEWSLPDRTVKMEDRSLTSDSFVGVDELIDEEDMRKTFNGAVLWNL
jgi:hypothetical protein